MLLGVVAVLGLAPGSSARGLDELRLPGRAISLAPQARSAEAVVQVKVASTGPRVPVSRSDFTLSAAGDMFAVQRWSAVRPRVTIAPRRSRTFRLEFGVPAAALDHGALYYRPARGGGSGILPLGATRHRAAAAATVNTFPLTQGVGEPWGTAVDTSGNIWFAEPGCDFAPRCGAGENPGQIGRLVPSTGEVDLHTLPNIAGNQPIFLALDGSGNVWFTTPNNDMIGEFSPSTGTFVGQWPLTSGTGPWDLTFANGRLWYTEHLASAVGAFDPGTHTHQDFQTPSGNTNPYGIAANGDLVWFTENNSSVNRIAVLDTRNPGPIAEYPIVAQTSNATPHLIAIGPDGHPWWTEGWANSIATLDPTAATPGRCGSSSGTCNGVHRFELAPATTCAGGTHTSGITFDAGRDQVWLDNSLTAQVGSFTPSTSTFDMTTLSNCNAHPHDGLELDQAGNVWFDEEFANALGRLMPPTPSRSAVPPASAPPAVGLSTAGPDTQAPAESVVPVNTQAPTIRGAARQGRILRAREGSWTGGPTVIAYRWQRCRRGHCKAIAGASRRAYRLAGRDIDARVRVAVTARNGVGSARAVSRGTVRVGPSVSRVKTALSRLLASTSHVAAGTTKRPHTGSFNAPSSGWLSIWWRARGVRLVHRHLRFAGAAHIGVALGAVAKLVTRSRLSLTAKAVFKPVTEPPVSRMARFTLTVP